MDKKEIEKKAEEVINKYNPLNLSPFPYSSITDEEPLNIIKTNLPGEGISGLIAYDVDKKFFDIFVDKGKSSTRQYFTVAHELGHYFLHREITQREEVLIDSEFSLYGSKILFRLDQSVRDRIETEANEFAAFLIMPSKLVRQAWVELEDVESCAKVFNVSIVAMSIRLDRLGLV